ncbi:MAG: Uma2 family endonuclease [Anaerolineae bacterium]|nr:Uma2 family endonuclease [Anaerolineae bacterium]MDW8171314.1 Uma2 family endonuclease [Anaerolineae bacterium]
MTIHEQSAEARVGMTLKDFLEAQEAQPFELLDGERMDKMPNVFGHTWYVRLLDSFALQHKLGEVFPESTYVQLADPDWVRGSRIPDLVFYVQERITAFRPEHPNWRRRPLSIAPDLTVEVVWLTERASDVTKK